MLAETFPRSGALRRIIRGAVTPSLVPRGFALDGSRSWLRRTGELGHVIALTSRYGLFRVQWGVVCPEATPVLHGPWAATARTFDVAASVLTGTSDGLHRPSSCPPFRLDQEVASAVIDDVVAALPADLNYCADWLEPLRTRQDLRRFLLSSRDETDRRGFIVPANLPLKLFTAATLAVLDGHVEAKNLIDEAVLALSSSQGEITRSRLERLAALADTRSR